MSKKNNVYKSRCFKDISRYELNHAVGKMSYELGISGSAGSLYNLYKLFTEEWKKQGGHTDIYPGENFSTRDKINYAFNKLD
jgi:hypothetical protein